MCATIYLFLSFFLSLSLFKYDFLKNSSMSKCVQQINTKSNIMNFVIIVVVVVVILIIADTKYIKNKKKKHLE